MGKQARGGFILRETEGKDVVFICTGTGVAPFRCMLFQLLPALRPGQKVYLIFGNRREKDLIYHSDFLAWEKQYSGFQYIPVLSRENYKDRAAGYVHGIYQNLFADGRDAWFYVCGWEAMCRDARQNLKDLGYNRRQYFFEQYD
jgi:NAD(P)H-flavin reductase